MMMMLKTAISSHIISLLILMIYKRDTSFIIWWYPREQRKFHYVSKKLKDMNNTFCFLVVKRLVKKENEEIKFDRNQTCFKDWKSPTDKDL